MASEISNFSSYVINLHCIFTTIHNQNILSRSKTGIEQFINMEFFDIVFLYALPIFCSKWLVSLSTCTRIFTKEQNNSLIRPSGSTYAVWSVHQMIIHINSKKKLIHFCQAKSHLSSKFVVRYCLTLLVLLLCGCGLCAIHFPWVHQVTLGDS